MAVSTSSGRTYATGLFHGYPSFIGYRKIMATVSRGSYLVSEESEYGKNGEPALSGVISLLTVQAFVMKLLNPEFVGIWAVLSINIKAFIVVYFIPSVVGAVLSAAMLSRSPNAHSFLISFGLSIVLYICLQIIAFPVVDEKINSIYWLIEWSTAWVIGFVFFYYVLAWLFKGPGLPFFRDESA